MKNPGKAGITEEEKQRRLEMHCSGMKNVEIAEALGISAQAVSSWLRRQRGVAQKPRKSVPRGKPLVPVWGSL